MCGYDDANVHADPASLVLSGRVRGPGQVDRFQLGEEIEIFVHLKNGTPQSRYCSVWKEKRANSCIYDNRRKWRKINQRHFRKKDQNKLVGMLLIF